MGGLPKVSPFFASSESNFIAIARTIIGMLVLSAGGEDLFVNPREIGNYSSFSRVIQYVRIKFSQTAAMRFLPNPQYCESRTLDVDHFAYVHRTRGPYVNGAIKPYILIRTPKLTKSLTPHAEPLNPNPPKL